MSIFVKEVRIKNFRSLKDVRVTLEPITVLVGANNAGKTSFLRALNLALGVEKRQVTKHDLYVGGDGKGLYTADSTKNQTITIDIKIEPAGDLEFDENWSDQFKGGAITSSEIPSEKEYLAFRVNYTLIGNTDNFRTEWFIIRNWDDENPNFSQEDDKLPAAVLQNVNLYFMEAQRDIQEDIRFRNSYFGKVTNQVEYDTATLERIENDFDLLNRDAIENAPVLKNMSDTLNKISGTIGSPSGRNIALQLFPKRVRDLAKNIRLAYKDGSSDAFDLDYHGMGTRSWTSILAFRAFIEQEQRNTQTLFPLLALEEPEAHLHPNAQRQLYAQLKEIPGQKIISTHSSYIVAQAELEELRLFYKSVALANVKALDLSNINKEEKRKIRREVLNRKGEVLFAKAIVLCEGETEDQALPIWAEAFFGQHPANLGITFMGVSGSNFRQFLILSKQFDIPYFILSDYDKPNVKTGLDNLLLEIENTTALSNVIRLENPIEKYLIKEGYGAELINIINALNPNTDPHNPTTTYFESFIKMYDGTKKGKTKIDTCATCNQEISEAILRDYTTDEGKNEAIYDCLKKMKTMYSAYLADETLKRCRLSRLEVTANSTNTTQSFKNLHVPQEIDIILLKTKQIIRKNKSSIPPKIATLFDEIAKVLNA